MKPMTMWSLICAFAAIVGPVALNGQTPGGIPFTIEKLDRALDDIVSPDATLETLGDRFALT